MFTDIGSNVGYGCFIRFKDGRLYSGRAAMISIIDAQRKITKFANRSYWSTLEFVADESGEIVQLKYDDYVGQKKSSYQLIMGNSHVYFNYYCIHFLLIETFL